MALKLIGSPALTYLAATDILIGDMSDVNYEFLLFDRPIIILANRWVNENFPDIGIKTDITGLSDAIERSISHSEEYREQRKYWLEKTIYKPDGYSSKRVVNVMIKNSKIKNPKMVFIHGDNPVRKANLKPLYEETKRRRIDAVFVKEAKKFGRDYENYINIAVHNKDLKNALGYNIHLDHGPRGKGTGNFEYAVKDYKDNGYFPFVHLHITAGEYGDEETKKLLGPYRDRTVIVGYPKGDDLLRCNTKENKELAYKKFKFDRNKILITYAPAGKKVILVQVVYYLKR